MLKINSVFLSCIFFAVTLGQAAPTWAENAAMLQTQNKLKQLDEQIKRLKQTLLHTQDKRGILNQELATTEKQLSQCVNKITLIEHDISIKQQHISRLKQQIQQLSHELDQQQKLLAQHVKARYKMGEYRPMIIALNQDNLFKMNRLLTYYQYLIQSRQTIMTRITDMRRKRDADQKTMITEITAAEVLQKKLQKQQQQFVESKQYHQVVIESLNQEIQTQQRRLAEYEQDRKNLSSLLHKLILENNQHIVRAQPFDAMRHKLPLPIQVARKDISSANQGVMFSAKEGSLVRAVYPGRVVFSDWLKGYGLLLIIDHGQGFMTLYAHNQALFKQKGAQVMQGEQIATIGHSGGIKQNGLYFEVRQGGRAIPPLDWLKAYA